MDYTGARMTLICQSSSHLMVSHAAAPESPHIHHNCGSIWQAAIRHFVQRWDPSGGSGRCASMDQTWSNSYSAEVDFHQFSSTLMLQHCHPVAKLFRSMGMTRLSVSQLQCFQQGSVFAIRTRMEPTASRQLFPSAYQGHLGIAGNESGDSRPLKAKKHLNVS